MGTKKEGKKRKRKERRVEKGEILLPILQANKL